MMNWIQGASSFHNSSNVQCGWAVLCVFTIWVLCTSVLYVLFTNQKHYALLLCNKTSSNFLVQNLSLTFHTIYRISNGYYRQNTEKLEFLVRYHFGLNLTKYIGAYYVGFVFFTPIEYCAFHLNISKSMHWYFAKKQFNIFFKENRL